VSTELVDGENHSTSQSVNDDPLLCLICFDWLLVSKFTSECRVKLSVGRRCAVVNVRSVAVKNADTCDLGIPVSGIPHFNFMT